jgi:hypothetical protein
MDMFIDTMVGSTTDCVHSGKKALRANYIDMLNDDPEPTEP